MTHHPADATLHALLDGELSPSAAAETERHVAACPRCADVVGRLERLHRLAARAPRELEPPAHVWRGVENAIRAQGAAVPEPADSSIMSRTEPAATSRRAAWHGPWSGLAAAALLCVAVGTVWYLREAPDGRAPAIPGDVAAVPERGPALGALLQELEARRPLFAPQTIGLVEDALQALDEAIAATQRALASDPDNPHLGRMLDQSQRQREEYLRTTMALAVDL